MNYQVLLGQRKANMNKLKTKDWDIIESALWFAKQKSSTFGEQEKFNKVYLKVTGQRKEQNEETKKH